MTALSAKSTKVLENCNLQFSFNYTKYYTLAIFACKSLIYMDF